MTNLNILFLVKEMTSLCNNFIHRLRFYIENDAPKAYVKSWEHLKKICESMDEDETNEYVSERLKNELTLESTKCLPILEREEGGIGMTQKNIRFRMQYGNQVYPDNDIYFNVACFGSEMWTYEELDDICCAFITVANNFIGSEGVCGRIEIEPHNE